EFRTYRHHVVAARRQCDGSLGALPYLDQRGGIAKELLSCRRQLRAGLVANEQRLAELLLEHFDPRADRGLCQVEARRRVDEAACPDDLEKGPRRGDIHTPNFLMVFRNNIRLPYDQAKA